MFTGIVEAQGTVKEVITNRPNKSFWIESPIGSALEVDQSVCHDGACLTIEETRDKMHRVTAVSETLKKTNLDNWEVGKLVNLERSLQLNSRLDGHLVQGHVDTTGICVSREETGDNREFTFRFSKKFASLIIEKGSVSVNGISLTAFAVKKRSFKVTIVPYTFDHTNIGLIQEGDKVNLEFDMVGKYISRHFELKT